MSEHVRTGRRAGGGGAAHRSARSAASFETAKYIERKIPNEEAIEIIEANAERLLEEIGVNFVGNEPALQRWRDVGADVK